MSQTPAPLALRDLHDQAEQAARSNNAPELRLALARGAALPGVGALQNWLLIQACLRKHADCVQALLDAGADPNFHDIGASREAPLFIACRHGDLPTLALLLSGGADPNAIFDHHCALSQAGSRAPIAQALLKAGANPSLQSALMSAPIFHVLDEGYDPFSETPHDSSETLEILEALVLAGADLSAVDHSGLSPIERALADERPDFVAAIERAELLRQSPAAAVVKKATL